MMRTAFVIDGGSTCPVENTIGTLSRDALLAPYAADIPIDTARTQAGHICCAR